MAVRSPFQSPAAPDDEEDMRLIQLPSPALRSLDESLLIEGDVRQALAALPADSVQCVVTSPPYWGLRDYGISGQIGLESSMAGFLEALTQVFREVRRVLRPDGVCWLNIGDGFTSGNRGWRAPDKKNPNRAMGTRPDNPPGLKDKDLIGIPWRLAFALQDSGWYLRSDVVWNKPNAMPESVKDRPTRSHEYLFMLTKSAHYTWHPDAVKERAEDGSLRNRRSVWSVNTASSVGSHIAAFPPALVTPCILSSSQAGDFVLDPFSGSGTVGEVSRGLGREYIGVELNPAYNAIALKRLTQPSAMSIPRRRITYPIFENAHQPTLLERPGDRGDGSGHLPQAAPPAGSGGDRAAAPAPRAQRGTRRARTAG
jgi:site-specific DNA-methyltransferase (adenine-specific)